MAQNEWIDGYYLGSAANNETAKAKIEDTINNNGNVYLAFTYNFDERNGKSTTFNKLMKKGWT